MRRVTHECPKLTTSSNSTSEWARSHGHENLAMRALVSCYTIEAIYSSLFVSCCFLFLALVLYEEVYGLWPVSSVSVGLLGGLTCLLFAVCYFLLCCMQVTHAPLRVFGYSGG